MSSGLSFHPVLDGVPDGWSLLFVNIHSYMHMYLCDGPFRDTAPAWIWAEGLFFEEIVNNYVCVLYVTCLSCIYYVLVLLTSVAVDPY